ncbi:hypothetical protein GWK47_030408 [Chionoecetes opilio]|uniref:Uncharacterized protein n=1 Tax=Chionoecetes opilio TaxID=41210 RepID=A0A8J5D573_CHIOP|nr:hypothetical protein GWK47_030408 [Chionoecetes opilio]
MFHILEDAAHKGALVLGWHGNAAPPCITTGKHRLVLRVATLGGCRNQPGCGTPCTCALWNTTSAATSLRCSSESRGLTGSNRAGGSWGVWGSAASTSRRARRWMLSSLRVCEAAHDIQERRRTLNLDGFLEWERKRHQTAASLPLLARRGGTEKPPLPVSSPEQSSPANVYPTPV